MLHHTRKSYCPICGVKGNKKGDHYQCINCETVFSHFGIISGPFDDLFLPSEIENLKNLLEDN